MSALTLTLEPSAAVMLSQLLRSIERIHIAVPAAARDDLWELRQELAACNRDLCEEIRHPDIARQIHELAYRATNPG